MICRNECLSYGFNKPLAQGSGKLKEGLEEVQAQHWPTCCQIGAVCELQQHLYLCCCCQVASVVFNSVRPHRQQPTRLPCPWDSPGKNTGVGCHFLLQCMKVKSLSHVWLFETPWTVAYQAPPSMGFSGQEHRSGSPFTVPAASLPGSRSHAKRSVAHSAWKCAGKEVLVNSFSLPVLAQCEFTNHTLLTDVNYNRAPVFVFLAVLCGTRSFLVLN